MTADPAIRAALREAAAKIRHHIEQRTAARCEPTYMDADDQWWQIRYWPDLGLARHDTGPHGRRSKVRQSRHWAHDLMPGTYPTVGALLAAMDAAVTRAAAPEGQSDAK